MSETYSEEEARKIMDEFFESGRTRAICPRCGAVLNVNLEISIPRFVFVQARADCPKCHVHLHAERDQIFLPSKVEWTCEERRRLSEAYWAGERFLQCPHDGATLHIHEAGRFTKIGCPRCSNWWEPDQSR